MNSEACAVSPTKVKGTEKPIGGRFAKVDRRSDRGRQERDQG